jgi:hypothetical protein
VGTPTGKRLVVPVDIFETGSAATFTQEKREKGVDFHYPQFTQDALRINFKQGFEVEALPKTDKINFGKSGLYQVSAESSPTSITTRRTFAMGESLFEAKEYSSLRDFYSRFQTDDKEKYVLKTTPVVAENKEAK